MLTTARAVAKAAIARGAVRRKCMRHEAGQRRLHNTRVPGTEPDGIVRAGGRPASAWWIALPSVAALALLLAVAAWFGLVAGDAHVDAEAGPPAAPVAVDAPPLGRSPRGAEQAEPTDLAQRPSPSPVAAFEEGSGIAAFSPPGTKPLLRGLVVPEDFQLPPGYVRHYQATDEGERLPAILMFHPSYRPLDADGKPVPLPADRVVPPELAPPGFPIQPLVLPEGAPGEPAATPGASSQER